MTLVLLLEVVGVIALFFTLVGGFLFRSNKNFIISFLQYFCGILFLVSGFVKAVDPMGTSFKMQDYFMEFAHHLEPTWLGFMTPVFGFLDHYSIWFSVFVIVLEIVIGLMLMIGYLPKLTSRIFFWLVFFFTLLTGFTYLTGYVPQDSTFFDFSSWGPYSESNMRVTDCGCFGDFIKLQPAVSFFKDVALFIPAVIFLFGYKSFHQLFTGAARASITGVMSLVTLIFCFTNYLWDLPIVDFRPFKIGANISEQKKLEDEAQSNIEILGYKLTNKVTAKVVELGYDQYMSNYKMYPKEEWDAEQIQSEPTVPRTKISDFVIYENEEDISEVILHSTDPLLLVVSYKAPYTDIMETQIIDNKTLYRQDTSMVDGQMVIQEVEDTVISEERMVYDYKWKTSYKNDLEKKVGNNQDGLENIGVQTYLLVGGGDMSMNDSFKEVVGQDVHICSADDILLKTIVRSNPGFVLLQDGWILGKWHKDKFSVDKVSKALERNKIHN